MANETNDLPPDPDLTLDADATIAAEPAVRRGATDELPATIGPYRILRRLGEGGMGEVFLAEQSEPIKRLVALKVIKPGMDSRTIVGRFELERQTLALMNHPGIARVYDAGQTELGRPYFAMEYVEGRPIGRYCDKKRLTTRQRLELITEVCAAVQHAHQKAVIHRDLKPGNILIAEVDGKPVPKIIDFGIARATEQRYAEQTMFTQFGHVIGTPAYMSPEQTDPTNTDIDTRADIYSLGVVLYELLVGLTPFDVEEVHSAGYEAMMKFVREHEAPRPSTRLKQSGARTTEVALRQHTEPDRLVRTLRGDLDWILLKALDRDRARRYETANDLAQDIRRYLSNEPVLASPPTAAYRAGKFVRRHRSGVAAAVVAAVVLLAFVTTTSVQNRVIARERDRAELEADKAVAINNFLRDMLTATDPWMSGEHDLTVVDAMDAARADVDSIFAGQPLVAAEVHATMGQTYLGLQKLDVAETEVRKGLELRTALLGPDHPELADGWLSLSKIQRFNLQAAAAIASAGEAVRIRDLAGDPANLQLLIAYDNLAEVLITDRRFAPADSVLDELAAVIAATPADRRPNTASMLSLRARIAAESREDWAAADSLGKEAVRLLRESKPDSPLIPVYLNNLAVNQMLTQDYVQAEATYQEALVILERLFGKDHPEYAVVLENLGGIAFRQKRYAECLASLEQVREIRARKMGEDHPTVMRTMLNMAAVANGMGDHDKALAIYAEVLPRLTAINGETHVDTAAATRNQAQAFRESGRYAEAETSLRRARAIYVALHGVGHQQVARTDMDLGQVRIGQERWREAAALISGAVASLEAESGRADRWVQAGASRLVTVYEKLGDTAKAAEYRAYKQGE